MNNRRHKESDYCRRTGKKRFRDAREATRRLQELRNLARILDSHGRPHTIHVVRKYQCSACQGWHLTSWKDYGPPTAGPDPLIRSLARGLAA